MPLAAVAGVKGAGKGNGTTKGTGKGKGARHTKRAGVVHPPGKSDVTLFHGTDELSSATTLKAKVQLSVIKHGDLHDVAVPGVDGGFYMTDSLVGAAQFACRNINPPAKSSNKVYVLEFKWSGASLPVKDFKDDAEYQTFLDYDKSEDNTNRDPTLDAIMTDNAMISSPMNAKGADDLLGKDFWQYAVIKQTAADNNLKYFTTHEVICSTVPPGEELADVMYAVGQKSNPQFPQMLEAVTTCPGNYDWKAAFAKLHASG